MNAPVANKLFAMQYGDCLVFVKSHKSHHSDRDSWSCAEKIMSVIIHFDTIAWRLGKLEN